MTYDKKLRCGVYIDGSNMIWGSLNMSPEERWFIDYSKLKQYLKKRYRPLFYKFYCAQDTSPKSDHHIESAKRQAKFYAKIEGMGYDVVSKPLKYIKQEDGSYITKGDMDVELTMGIMDTLDDVDTIILFAGDCDYLAAVRRFHAAGKYIRIISYNDLLSWELRTFAMNNPRCSYKTIESMKDDIEFARVVDNSI